MDKFIAERVKEVEISGIRKFFNKVSKVEGAISLTLGQPDFSVPEKIKEALVKAIEEDRTTYTPNAGIEELREEISLFLQNQFNINYGKEEICVTVGGSEALFSTFKTIINYGDKVLIPTPAYPAYESCVTLCGGECVNYHLNEDFSIDIENLRKQIEDEKIKAIVLSFPSNPTGATLSKQDLEQLTQVLLEKDIVIISDEIYSSLCFEDVYYSPAQVEELRERVILISGFSKMFSMTGLRLGYVCASKDIISEITKVHLYNVSCATSVVQYGVLEGLKNSLNEVFIMKEKFIERRDYVYNRLKNIGFDVYMPKGAFYIFPSIKQFGISSEEFCERLLKEKKVAIVPGKAFGIGGEGYIRISYCYGDEQLEKALSELESFVKLFIIAD
ncbi:pyridoxal phosphate-dependent aminotransferase [Clostridium sp. DL1XJH146]